MVKSEKLRLRRKDAYMIEEYKALRAELVNSINHSRRIIYMNIVAVGLLWSFILSSKIEFDPVMKWVPLVICLLSTVYLIAIRKDIRKIGNYLLELEQSFLHETGLGWEKHLRNKKNDWFSMADYWENAFWSILILLNIYGALFFLKN